MNFLSKLPNVGTTIFTIMSKLAQENHAVNLSQGFPDFDPSPKLMDLVTIAMKSGHNQYATMSGVKELREEIAKKSEEIYGSIYHPESEVTVTTGGSEAIFSIISAFIHSGDEVILFEPAFDLYRPVIELFGGKVKAVQLKAPEFTIDWNEVKNLISPKTKMILLNNPNNPATYLLKPSDFQSLIKIVQDTEILVLSDEVYEHMVFDEEKFISVSQFPELKNRSFVVASFGKLFHITGWKVGYFLAPEELTREVRKVHQYNTFSVSTPFQFAIAEFLKNKSEYLHLPEFFQQKRDFLIEGLKSTPFEIIPPKGTYYLLADYSQISDLNDLEFSKYLTEKYKVATIPLSAFYEIPPQQKLLRICFAKKEETLEKAIELLNKI
ncbi:methionine aminotransferase [Moheibacter lacus]|uniref:Aminotransferase class I/II-fold pyridoxal phosphate-dependent enzyme n=1 Tax=Moheibacter lacus TaxID=2745851 RepID=A0A838ZK22_9FLAO|nr:methionine aminotransferase [Moheibacter lacus]MBA5628724.1 aminotransferase class I/II-fold pyridoxal phosphate-dependent enzyme [Moheibacter lacus]